jgi:hypothetical protein
MSYMIVAGEYWFYEYVDQILQVEARMNTSQEENQTLRTQVYMVVAALFNIHCKALFGIRWTQICVLTSNRLRHSVMLTRLSLINCA